MSNLIIQWLCRSVDFMGRGPFLSPGVQHHYLSMSFRYSKSLDLPNGPRPLKWTGRHGHFLNLTGRHDLIDSDIGSNNIVTYGTLAFLKCYRGQGKY